MLIRMKAHCKREEGNRESGSRFKASHCGHSRLFQSLGIPNESNKILFKSSEAIESREND